MEGLNNTKIEDAINTIMAIQQEVAIMGSNDYEIPALNKLIEHLKKGEISSGDAIAQATKIRDSKQDYH
jgi:hypothetical protein